jgi:hypothetical protein
VVEDLVPAPADGDSQHELAKAFVPLPLPIARPEVVGSGSFYAQVDGLEGWSAQDDIQQRGVVSLDDEEEDFFEGNVEQLGSNNNMARVAPDAGSDEVGIPWYGR